MTLRVEDLTFGWPDRPPLFEHTSLRLEPGWTGLVGPNGGGKTTLLGLLAGVLRPDAGRVVAPGVIHLCPQEVTTITPAIRDLAWGVLGDAPWRWQRLLDLDPEALERWSTLSPGERKRWQIGAALASDAPVLLLDEPTNHLDADARAMLVEALAAFDGVGVLVSHDRALLDALTTTTVGLRPRRDLPLEVRVFPGPYAAARRAWSDAASARLAALDAAQDAARAARDARHAARQRAEATEAGRSARRLMRNPHDHDGRTLAAKTRAEWAAGKAARRAAHARDAAQDAELTLAAHERPEPTLGRSVFLDYAPATRDPLLARTGAPLTVPGRVLAEDVHLTLHPREHVHVAGPNGAGKTTLLHALLVDAALPPERLLWLPQDLAPGADRALLDRLHALPPGARGRTLQIVAALGVDPARLLATDRPSPGEARKLALALGMGEQAWLLVLDEPTNHLDLPSVERLQEALVAWPGALLLVTHDDALAAATCATTWHLRDGRVAVVSR